MWRLRRPCTGEWLDADAVWKVQEQEVLQCFMPEEALEGPQKGVRSCSLLSHDLASALNGIDERNAGVQSVQRSQL
jgi:hypothetical protein